MENTNQTASSGVYDFSTATLPSIQENAPSPRGVPGPPPSSWTHQLIPQISTSSSGTSTGSPDGDESESASGVTFSSSFDACRFLSNFSTTTTQGDCDDREESPRRRHPACANSSTTSPEERSILDHSQGVSPAVSASTDPRLTNKRPSKSRLMGMLSPRSAAHPQAVVGPPHTIESVEALRSEKEDAVARLISEAAVKDFLLKKMKKTEDALNNALTERDALEHAIKTLQPSLREREMEFQQAIRSSRERQEMSREENTTLTSRCHEAEANNNQLTGEMDELREVVRYLKLELKDQRSFHELCVSKANKAISASNKHRRSLQKSMDDLTCDLGASRSTVARLQGRVDELEADAASAASLCTPPRSPEATKAAKKSVTSSAPTPRQAQRGSVSSSSTIDHTHRAEQPRPSSVYDLPGLGGEPHTGGHVSLSSSVSASEVAAAATATKAVVSAALTAASSSAAAKNVSAWFKTTLMQHHGDGDGQSNFDAQDDLDEADSQSLLAAALGGVEGEEGGAKPTALLASLRTTSEVAALTIKQIKSILPGGERPQQTLLGPSATMSESDTLSMGIAVLAKQEREILKFGRLTESLWLSLP
eukprot:GHVN01051467.1.p1 GENE.GHVN01051467.1~~GHVN01051467.1.p1  ORF type:complete len:595 (+),score=138.13 GHVN01051467.1:2129-3913(+)